MEDVFVKGLYDNVFDLINNKLPYVDNKHLEKELIEAKKILNVANVTFEKYRSVLNEDSIKHFEYYAYLASGCLNILGFINDIEELINDKNSMVYLPTISRCLNSIDMFVKQFENEEIVTDIIEKFLIHLSSISEYYKAIVAGKTNGI